MRAPRYAWDGATTERTTGRPRERWHVSDYPNRIDANELRRRAKADGLDLSALRSIDVRPADRPDDPGERKNLAASRPEVVARLKAEIAEWDRGNVPAQWTSMRQAVRRHEGQMLKIYP